MAELEKDLATANPDASQNTAKVNTQLDGNHNEHDKSGVKILLDKALSSKIRLPMLDVIYDRFVRMTSNSLRNFTSYNVDVEISKMDSIRLLTQSLCRQ
jgi:flagellar motor switch protein FliM